VWLLLAGRGFGKTRVANEWVRYRVESGQAQRIALVARTAADVRDVVVEGESGLLAISPPWNRPTYEPSKRRLTWPNGAIATTYSGDQPDQLRGPQHDTALADELAAWRYPEAWDQLMFGLRLGNDPRVVVATTPRPTPIVKKLAAHRRGVVTRGSTLENVANLAPVFLDNILETYQGTRLGRQELDAEILDDNPGALWKRDQIEALRVNAAPALKRVIVAVDPSATSGGDETGIVVAGIGADDQGYVIDDLSLQGSPHEWASRAVGAYHTQQADRLIGETNNGGEMVELTIRTVDKNVSYKGVHASRGKRTRAEPVAALYEQCLALGTLVETARGAIPIESVTTNDRVWTRKGLRRVLWSGQTGMLDTLRLYAGDHKLTCTADHPVHTARGFIRAGQLAPKCDILTTWKNTHVQNAELRFQGRADGARRVRRGDDGQPRANPLGCLSCFRGSDTTSRQTGTIAQDAIAETSCYTEQFGKPVTGQSLMDGIFTIETGIPRTMMLGTWSLLRQQSTRQNVTIGQVGKRRLEQGRARLEKTGGKDEHQWRLCASNVEGSSLLPPQEFASVPLPVTHGTGITAVENGPKLPVYNLMIADEPEFFANGILVHNCKVHHVGMFAELEDQMCDWVPDSGQPSPDRMDALVWALTELMLAPQVSRKMVTW